MLTDYDYGENAKIGLIYPSAGWVMETEMAYMAPSGVSVQTTRIGTGPVTVDTLNGLNNGVSDAAKLLQDIPVDSIVLGCTSASFINSAKYDKKMNDEYSKNLKIPFTTTSASVVKALNTFGVKKVSVVTPYIEELNKLAKTYLEDTGFEVVNLIGLGLLTDLEMGNVSLDEIYNLALKANEHECDAVLILCTGLRTIPIIDKLEKKLNKPIVTAIQASMWNALKLADAKGEITDCGSLFKY